MTPQKLQAVVLIGGLGSRLGSLTKSIPKPLLPIGTQPFLKYLLDNLEHHGFEHTTLLAGYQAQKVKDFLDEYSENGMTVSCVIETEPAGTSGAILQGAQELEDHFLLVNGDTLFDINYLDLMTQRSAICTLALREMPKNDRYGGISLSKGIITEFNAPSSQNGSSLINGGVYWMSKKILGHCKQGHCSLEHDVFPELSRAKLLHGIPFNDYFIDIGVPDDFARAQHEIPTHFKRPAVLLESQLILRNGRLIDQAAQAIKELNRARRYVFAYQARGATNKARRQINTVLRAHGAHIDGILAGDESNAIELFRQAQQFGEILDKNSYIFTHTGNRHATALPITPGSSHLRTTSLIKGVQQLLSMK